MALSTKQVNARLAQFALTVQKVDNSYFVLVDANEHTVASVMVASLSHLTLDQWEEEARAAVATNEQPQHDGVDDIAAYGEFGAGTAEAPACPHCGIDHKDNGYGAGDTREHTCLACGGEWGAEHAAFAADMEAFKAAGNSKCKALRLTAAKWLGMEAPSYTRKNFIADAMEYGVKEATASANWAAAKRGDI